VSNPALNQAAGRWVIDAAHSYIGFAVRHLMGRVRGRFTEFSGEIVVGDDPTRSSVSVTIEAASVHTGHEGRDERLRGKAFLDVERAQTMRFASTGLRHDGDGWLLSGDLTIGGVTKGVEIVLEPLGVDPTGLQGERRAGFDGRTAVMRSDFGLDLPHGNRVVGDKVVFGDRVDIHVEIEAVLSE
jgi:polyisoprenoid-binding protein YceI